MLQWRELYASCFGTKSNLLLAPSGFFLRDNRGRLAPGLPTYLLNSYPTTIKSLRTSASNVLRNSFFQRSPPFNVHSFFNLQSLRVNMGSDPEKERVSADIVRSRPDSPVLPTVNPNIEKVEQPASTIHPAVYVV